MDGFVFPDTAPLESSDLRQVIRQRIALGCHKLAHLSFAATVILIPFRMRQVLVARPIPPIYHDYTDLILFASDLFLLATLASWILGLALQPHRLKAGPLFLSAPILGLCVVSAVSAVTSVDPAISAYHVIRLVGLTGLYFFALNEVSLNQLILPVALQACIQAMVGIAQVLQQHSLGIDSLQELALDPSWSGVSVILADGIRTLRAYGLTDHPNILGGCLAFGLLWMGAWYAGSRTRWHTLLTVAFSLSTLGLLLTFSRSAWLALAGGLGAIIFLFVATRQGEPLARWLSLAGAAMILLVPFLWHNLPYLGVRLNANDAFGQVTLENRSLSERDYLVQGTLEIWREHPLLGIGIGASPEAERLRYPDPNEFGADYQPVHVALLAVLVETGPIGAILYLAAMALPWFALAWNRKRLIFSPALIGMTGILLAVTVVGFLDYYAWLLAPGQLWQWLIWGAWGGVYTNSLSKVTTGIGASHA